MELLFVTASQLGNVIRTKLLHENRGAVQRSGASREQAQSIQSLNPAMIQEHEF